jgi:hypothetical protein
MVLNRQGSIAFLPIWCLLSLWLFFGCLELAEQFQLVPETIAEDQAEQDFDQEALSQLASGLRPVVPSLGAPGGVSFITAIIEPPHLCSVSPVYQGTGWMGHRPPSLRLHQQLSVYRI